MRSLGPVRFRETDRVLGVDRREVGVLEPSAGEVDAARHGFDDKRSRAAWGW